MEGRGAGALRFRPITTALQFANLELVVTPVGWGVAFILKIKKKKN